ncbi:hypothetical protein FHP29_12585 [Nocardioides albidus]|uniref:Uncharacterized protein n=1 Tax=Nocardioides albidus TaxID=1517589 RepID=A0A5C4VV52_9ACTN|nr:hypothetical protein [Nocardioides albidus]TNM39697.1 hypothetical protein FHP29_12585 [Nocardioides albidus]
MTAARDLETTPAPTPRVEAAPRRTTAPRGPAAMLALQRAAGNRAVTSAVQRGAVGPAAVATAPVAEAGVAPVEAETSVMSQGAPRVQRGYLDDLAAGARRSAMEAVSNYAKRMPGYDLLCMVLGKDVISDAPVPRSAAGLIDGVLGLIPGADKVRANLQESGATEKAGQWLETEVPKLGLNWETIKALFRTAWDALDITDIADPAGAFRKIQGIFGPPLGRLRDFALAAGKKALEFVFEGALSLAGGAGAAVMGVIKRAGGVFDQIVANPMGFLGNLVSAVRGGLGNFVTNIGTHLKNGLVAWLTGSLGGVIRIPERFDLRGILGMALDFLGLTWAKVKGKLGALVGADTMDMLEKGVDKLAQGAGFIGDLFKRGLSAITDRISEFAGGLVGQVMDGIKEWVAKSVVGAAITKLISMFNPAGAVIQAIIAIYNTVQFFIERGQQIASLASAIFDSIAEIASGNIGKAVEWVEGALGRAVPVALGFLSRLIGIGDIAEPVRGVITRVQGVVDQALDKAMAWVAKAGAPIFAMVRRVAGRIRAGMDSARAWVRGQADRVRRGARGLAERLGLVRHPFTAGSEAHTLSIEERSGRILLASSDPQPVEIKIGQRYDALRARWTEVGTDGQQHRQLPDRATFVARVAGQVRDAESRIRAAGEGAPAVARAKFAALGPLISDVLVDLSSTGSTPTPAGAGVVPNLGRIAPWSQNKNSNRKDPKPERWLESEHVIDHDTLSTLAVTAGFRPLTAADKNRQHTIMIYKSAANKKNTGAGGALSFGSSAFGIADEGAPSLGGQNEESRRRRAQDAERARLIAAGEDPSQHVRSIQQAGVRAVADWRARATAAAGQNRASFRTRIGAVLGALVGKLAGIVRQDHTGEAKLTARGHPDIRPNEDQIRDAASRQVLDVVDSLVDRGGEG